MSFRRCVIVAGFLSCAVAASADRVDDFIQKEMKDRHIPGLALAIYKDGKPIKVRGYGYADLEQGVKVSKDTVFEIGSITKQFTCTALLMLADEGKLRLDDSVSKYLDGIPDTWSGVTLRRLMNHTSGIGDPLLPIGMPQGQAAAIKSIVSAPIAAAPGERWAYNNSAYFLLGFVIEKVSGKRYFDFLNERIFKPLEMTHTTSTDTTPLVPKRARGYNWTPRGFVNGQPITPTQGFAAGAILSTVGDMGKWDRALAGDRFLKPWIKQELWRAALLESGETVWTEVGGPYGLGFFLRDVPGHRIVKHSGGTWSFSAQFTRLVDDNLSVVVLTNKGQYEQRPFIGDRIAAFYVPQVAVVRTVIPDDPDVSGMLAKLMSGWSAGTLDDGPLTPRLAGELKSLAEFIKARYKPFGEVKRMELLERVKQGKRTIYVYRATFASGPRLVTATMIDGKLDDLEDGEE